MEPMTDEPVLEEVARILERRAPFLPVGSWPHRMPADRKPRMAVIRLASEHKPSRIGE